MESIGETLPSWLLSSPGLVGAGVILIALVLMVLRRRSVVVHGVFGGQSRPNSNLPGTVDGSDAPTAFEKIEQELEAGRLISAIKLYRDETGASLREAKDAVERMQRELAELPSGAGVSDNSVDLERVRQELAAGRNINAIKLYRETTGAGLKEATEQVERMRLEQWGLGTGETLPVPALGGGASLDDEVAGLLARDQNIEAIKLTRDRLRLGLKEAKDYVDNVEHRSPRS